MTNTFAHLRVLFERCVDIAEGDRLAWIEQNVPDTTLRIELALMLAADAGATTFLKRDVVSRIGAFDAASAGEFNAESLLGRRFGSFQLERLLGQGGQGTVYLAERVAEDFHQTVAIKLLRRGIHEADEHRRFRREREILARFEHPGVARLIDGGVSGDGVPYLAMEYVDGEAIDRWCEVRELDCTQRLQLFSELCRVVAEAHRVLIVHRDLKPSNVLVTDGGAIKVLDFGIAHLLDEDEATRTRSPMMTPGYGAPEQANGGPITLSTDVYALGVLLRVLLTGNKPSAVAADAPITLPATLPPELRWIIGRATLAEPELRYRDAAEFDDDVQRFLGSRPVHAHPPSRWYRTRKFVNRHRGGVMVTTAFVVAVIASLGIALWQAKTAREQAWRAQAARDFLLGIFASAQQDLPRDARPTPDVLVRAAVKKLDADKRLAPDLRAEFLGTLSTISFSSNDNAQAIEQAELGLRVLAEAGQGASRQALALQIKRANALVSLGKPEEAEQALGPRLNEIRSVADEIGVQGLAAYAGARIVTGHMDEAIALVREAADLASRVYSSLADEALIAELEHGDALAFAGRNQEAQVVLEAALAKRRASDAPPDHHQSNSLGNLATVKYHLGDLAASEGLMRESLDLSRRIYTAPHEKIADALFSLSVPLMDAGRVDEAEQLLLEAAAMYVALFGPLHPQNAGMLDGLGSLAMSRQDFPKAVDYLQRATRICIEAKLETHPDCARYWQNLSHAYLRLGKFNDADAANAQSLRLRRALYGEQHPAYAGSLAGRAAIQLAQSKPAAALATIDQALAIMLGKGQSASLGGASMRKTRAQALKNLHRYPEALTDLNHADTLMQQQAPSDMEFQMQSITLRAEILDEDGRIEQARDLARKALKLGVPRTVITEERWQRLEAMAR